MSDSIVLTATDLSRSFGALRATDGVSLTLRTGEIHALIGPNGAGKSTLIHLLSGTLKPDSGRLVLGQQDITAWSAHERVRAGLARSYQITNIFRRMPVLDNLVLACQAAQGRFWGFLSPRARDRALREAAEQLAEECNLQSMLGMVAGTLPHGEQRKLEFALALAARPKVLLLDEPMAGMGPDESHKLTELIASLQANRAILLVEHDMQAVFKLAQCISVLVYGRIIASGSPDDIRNSSEVQAAYLGDSQEAA